MADATPTAGPAATPAQSNMYEIYLSRSVSFYGFSYKPGRRHVVDEATLTLMGDAVAEKKQIKG